MIEEEEEHQEEEGDLEEHEEYGDEGEVLVIRRLLNASHSQEEHWLRENIFQTRCTSHGRVCNLIIDGGSCTNVVSEEMVTKLSLSTEPHPKPYKIQWFKNGNGVSVSKRCLVSFSIGKSYQDEIWCDVVPMDACHILLGRPWLFDRRVMHDGFKNTYSFIKDGKKIILNPMKPLFSSKGKKEDGQVFLTGAQIS